MPGFGLYPVPYRPLQLWFLSVFGYILDFFHFPLETIMAPILSKVVINQRASDPQISVYQVLFRTPELRLALSLKNRPNRDEQKLKEVFQGLQRDERLQIKPDCKTHDAAEHMEQLLKNLSPDVRQPFCGALVCAEGHTMEMPPDSRTFQTLRLPFTATVEKGVQQVFECTCKNKESAKGHKPPPQILVFHLERLTLTHKKMPHLKSDCEVELTETLETQGHTYALCGVVDHRGRVREGHYTATIKEGGTWRLFGEGSGQVPDEEGSPNGRMSATAVLIIYRQKGQRSESCGSDPYQQTWPEPGPHGLRNQGATCYLNSVLQVLFMTPGIHEALKDPLTSTDKAVKGLFDKLQWGPCETRSVTDDLWAPNVQRCAAEYLELLLSRLSPHVSEPFHGELLDITLCSERHCVNQETSKFWTFPVSMEHSGGSVSEGFARFFKEKRLRGIYCNECKKTTEATSKYEMTKCPQTLVLLLKCFDTDGRSGYTYKSHRAVEIPGTLPTEGVLYSLCGVVDHSGDLYGGHYTATLQSTKDGHWYCFNDTDVRKVGVPHHRSSTAYLLIYTAAQTGMKSWGRAHVQQNDTERVSPAAAPEDEAMDWPENNSVQRNSKHQQVDHGPSMGQFDHGPSMGQFDHGQSMGQFDHGPSMGQFDHGPSMGQFDHGPSMGQFDHGPSMGQFDHGQSMGQFDHGQSMGQFDHGLSMGQFEQGQKKGQFDHEQKKGQFDHGQKKGQFDHEQKKGQFDHGPSMGQFDHEEKKGQFDHGYKKGQFDHGQKKGQFDHGPSMGQFDHGQKKGQFDHEEKKGQFEHEQKKGQFDHEQKKGQFDHGQKKGQFDHGPSMGQFDHGYKKGQFDHEQKKGQFDHGQKKGQFDHEEKKGQFDHEQKKGQFDHGQKKGQRAVSEFDFLKH